MTIEKVKEHFKDAKIVESHEGVKFEIKNMDYIDNGLGCSKYCYYYSNRTIYLPNKGFAKIIEYKTKAKTLDDVFKDFGNLWSIRMPYVKTEFVEVPKGMEIDKVTFKKIEKQLPNSWEEFESQWSGLGKPLYGFVSSPIEYRNFRKLELLRDCYNDGWKADPDNNDFGYSYLNSIKGISSNGVPFLHLKTPELRKKFLKNFKDIIEIAKPLL